MSWKYRYGKMFFLQILIIIISCNFFFIARFKILAEVTVLGDVTPSNLVG
jgi:hypothetical protein